jgi:large subunit ribosomal protein L15
MMISDVLKQSRRNKGRKRVGRGVGTGRGKTCGRGHKGLGQRSGGGVRPLTEGGQMPLFRRIPKRGFTNAQFRTVYQVVNISDLARKYDDGARITPVELEASGLIHDAHQPVKILGDGEISKKLQVEATKFSKSAADKITNAGGKVQATGQTASA